MFSRISTPAPEAVMKLAKDSQVKSGSGNLLEHKNPQNLKGKWRLESTYRGKKRGRGGHRTEQGPPGGPCSGSLCYLGGEWNPCCHLGMCLFAGGGGFPPQREPSSLRITCCGETVLTSRWNQPFSSVHAKGLCDDAALEATAGRMPPSLQGRSQPTAHPAG